MTWLIAIPVAASGGIIVTVHDGTLQAGTDGYVDVTVRSDSSDAINGFVVAYQINAAGLEFATGPGEPNDLQLSDSTYVFPLSNSSAAANPPAGTVSTTVRPNDTYTGLDATIDGTDVLVPSTDVLLTRLHLVASTPGLYTISLDATSSVFVDSNFDSIPFQATSGEITVTAPQSSAIPEPASCVAWTGLIALFGMFPLRARKIGK